METDILIVGSGCSGLYCALSLPKEKKITVITKSDVKSNDSYLAQGGICVLKNEDDFEAFFEDTLRAGHYENDRESVRIMISSSREVIDELVGYGAEFSKNEDGSFNYTREGAHSDKRILFHEDTTGAEITSRLLKEVEKRTNIEIMEYTTLLDIVEKDGECVGAVIEAEDGRLWAVNAEYVVLATGGIGGLFKHSTNFKHLTGDALAIALRHGIELKDIDYIQIHPTTFYSKSEEERSFLISESVRGEGARLYNKQMKRFADELLPRDKLTDAIKKQMKEDNADFVWEDLRPIGEKELKNHFPNIVKYCAEKNFDVTENCIPVVPAQHYFMGGIKVDYNSKTSLEGLFAVGETACNGVHGRNRLASNSLLESLVFAKRAAEKMAREARQKKKMPELELSWYEDREKLAEEYKKSVLEAIERKGE